MNSSGPDCPAGRLEVVIRKIDISSGVITDHHTDNGFSFVVP